MKSVKKVFAVLLVAVLALSMGACKSETTSSQNTPTSQGTKDKVKITYSMWGSADEGAVTQQLADKFNASQDRIEVEVMAIPWENYMTKLNAMATANQLPDTGIMSEAGVLQWAEQGMLADIGSMYGANESKPLESLSFLYNFYSLSYSSSYDLLLLYFLIFIFFAAFISFPPSHALCACTFSLFVSLSKHLSIDISLFHSF